MRYGLYRARVNFYTAIVFGFFFFLVAACGASLQRTVKRRQRPLLAAGLAFALVGIMSSLSAGALMGAAFAGPLIVCFNDRDVLLPCLESIDAGQEDTRFEVILVDNGSRDGSVEAAGERFRDVRIVAPGYNTGYTGGNNYGFERATGRYVLFLNPDTILHPGGLRGMVARADRLPRAGAVVPHSV